MPGFDLPRRETIVRSNRSGEKKPQALILAAGRGQRLGDSADEFPKCLLQVGGSSLLDHQLNMLVEAGITDICVIAGYQKNAVERACQNRAHVIINPEWACTNSLYSLLLARAWVNRDLVVMNCDVLVDSSALSMLLNNKSSCFAYDSSSGDDDEHMKVEIFDGVLKSMSKDLHHSKVNGENVGMLYFQQQDSTQLFVHADALVSAGGGRQWMAEAVQLLARERALVGVDIKDLPWIEIDYHADLEKARDYTWPLIEQRRQLVSRGAAVGQSANDREYAEP